jgi:hypothetical protein
LLKEKSHNIFITVEKSTANLPKPLHNPKSIQELTMASSKNTRRQVLFKKKKKVVEKE